MRASEALKKIGGLRKAQIVADEVADRYGVRVEIAPHKNEADPTDRLGDFLNVLIEYAPQKEYGAFLRAFDDLGRRFSDFGLALEHECWGDGERVVIASYRVA